MLQQHYNFDNARPFKSLFSGRVIYLTENTRGMYCNIAEIGRKITTAERKGFGAFNQPFRFDF